jgi:putative transposase
MTRTHCILISVRVIRSVRCKISVPEKDLPIVGDLFRRYAGACSEIAQWGRDHRESNKIRLQHQLYYDIRRKYDLPANLTITALRRASGALESAKFRGKFQFRPTSVALDARTFTLKLPKGIVSFSVPGKRVTAGLEIGEYQHEALWGADLAQSATLVKAKDGYWVNIAIESEVPDAPPGEALGVDLGIRRIAATSMGTRFSGQILRKYRETRWLVRASLQSRGTKGAKRALKRLSGQERRRATWENHRISKLIVLEAVKAGCSTINVEDLRGITDRLKVWNRHRNRMISLWSFAQLREFICYKAAGKGLRILDVDPAYTSLRCHRCHRLGKRTSDLFSCTTCGEFDADVNAAKNIAAGGAKAGDIPANRNVARIVEFFAGESLHRIQSKAAGL